MCILHLGKNELEKYRLAEKWEQFKIVILFMDHPVLPTTYNLQPTHSDRYGSTCDANHTVTLLSRRIVR